MEGLGPQGPVSGVMDDQAGSQADEGKTKTKAKVEAPGKSTEGTRKTQKTDDGRADQTDKGTSAEKQAPDKSEETSFLDDFDPATLSDELKPAYQDLDKKFKAAFTKKSQALSKEKAKVEAYDAFMANPTESLRKTAEQYGFKVVPLSSANETGKGSQGEPLSENWQPGSWKEVFDVFQNQVTQAMMGHMKPVFESLQETRKDSVEKQLGEIDPNWKMYEDEMTETLKAHPTLAKDVAKLYRISVPEDVLKSKYTQQALKRFEEKAAGAKIQSKSTVNSSAAPLDKKLSFDDAVKEAKRTLGMT